MKHKLVFCTVREGSLVSQRAPRLSGVDWKEMPGTRHEAGRFYQVEKVARVPKGFCSELPKWCAVDENFDHVTAVQVDDRVRVYHQAAEGAAIEEFVL
jgi:hypothetical protein